MDSYDKQKWRCYRLVACGVARGRVFEELRKNRKESWPKNLKNLHGKGLVNKSAGRIIGNFMIIRRLGRGGQAKVFQACDLSMTSSCDSHKVVKLFPYTLNESGSKQFLREGRIGRYVNDIDHPNLIRTLNSCVQQKNSIEHRFLVFPHIGPTDKSTGLFRSESFCSRLTAGDINGPQALKLILQTATAIEAIHGMGICHRDVKLDNILIDSNQNAVLIDYGLAKSTKLCHETTDSEEYWRTPSYCRFLGTPGFSPPELTYNTHANPSILDLPRDIYSLGVCAWVVVTKKLPPLLGFRTVDEPIAELTKHHASETLKHAITTMLRSTSCTPSAIACTAKSAVDHLLKCPEFSPRQVAITNAQRQFTHQKIALAVRQARDVHNSKLETLFDSIDLK